MIVNRSIKIDDVSVQKNTVASTMFGANALQSVNTTDGGVPFENYETAITLAGVTNLRFPGGTGEVLNNLLVGSTSDTLAPDLIAFLSSAWSRAGVARHRITAYLNNINGTTLGF